MDKTDKHKDSNSTAGTAQLAAGRTRGALQLQSGRGGLSMDMKLGLGAKAKLALTDSLNQLNSKFRLGTFPGVVQNQALWTTSEMRVWMVVLFVGVVCLYGNQVALPMTVVNVEEELTWQRKSTVCSLYILLLLIDSVNTLCPIIDVYVRSLLLGTGSLN